MLYNLVSLVILVSCGNFIFLFIYNLGKNYMEGWHGESFNQEKSRKKLTRKSLVASRQMQNARSSRRAPRRTSPATMTMHFCPPCGNLLLLENVDGDLRFFCQTCPYIYKVTNKVATEMPLERKAIDDIMGGSEAWKNADQTAAPCPKCEAHRAYYQQLQIRSADEPMTTFYRCVSCGHNWREDG